MSRPLILVTNDDGIIAPGIKNLVSIVSKIGDVIVVSPDSPQSGQGHAITIIEPLRLNRVDAFSDIEAYECSGTPVDCVKLAKHVILKDRRAPDLCVSGINHGSNASINIIYSGTMSAAMEASLHGIDSIGFSLLDYSWDADFAHCEEHILKICNSVLRKEHDGTVLLNVNIPSQEPIQGIKICKQANGAWIEDFQVGEDPRGEKYYWLTGRFVNKDTSKNSDIQALEDGYISVVPSHHDLTKYDHMAQFQDLEI